MAGFGVRPCLEPRGQAHAPQELLGVAVDVDAKGVMDVFRARYEIGGGGKARTRMVVAGVLGVVRKVGSVLRGIVPRDILSNSKREK